MTMTDKGCSEGTGGEEKDTETEKVTKTVPVIEQKKHVWLPARSLLV